MQVRKSVGPASISCLTGSARVASLTLLQFTVFSPFAESSLQSFHLSSWLVVLFETSRFIRGNVSLLANRLCYMIFFSEIETV